MKVWTIVKNDGDNIYVSGVFMNQPTFEQFLNCVGINIKYVSDDELKTLKKEFKGGYVSSYHEIYIEEHDVKENK